MAALQLLPSLPPSIAQDVDGEYILKIWTHQTLWPSINRCEIRNARGFTNCFGRSTFSVILRSRSLIALFCRYYCAFNTPTETQAANSDGPLDPDAPTGDEQPIANGLPTDITLAALSQLGVFRTGSNRCFVSIIDGTNQFIISETTKSVSLRHKDKHIPDDGIYLGVRTLDLVWGVCPHTIKLFTSQDSSSNINTDNITANRSRYIIRDFTKEDCFKDRPYVRDWPHMRFYAEVPLFSAAGYVLGSYCVVDDKPRDNFDDEEVAVLQEVSDAIANHLENVRLVHFHRRAETLVKGLTSFVKETPEFEPTEASKDGYLVPLDMSLNLRHQSTDNRDAGDDFCSAHSGEQSGYNISILGRTSSTNISGPPLEFSNKIPVLPTRRPFIRACRIGRPS